MSPLAAVGAITQEPTLAQTEGTLVALGRCHQLAFDLTALEPTLEMRLVGIARIDDAFQLRRREETILDEGPWQEWAIGRDRRRHRGHGGGLDQRGRVFCRAIDPDRLEVIGLVDRVLQSALGFTPGFRQVVDRGRLDVVKWMFRAFFGEGAGFLAGGVAQGMQIACRTGRDRQGRTGRAGPGAAAFRAVG